MAGMKKRLVWGILAFLFVAGFTFYPGCGVDSGSSTGRPAYAVPGSGTGGGSPAGGGGTDPGGGSGGTDPGGGSGGGNLLELINDARQANGLSRLEWDTGIAAVAQAYAVWYASGSNGVNLIKAGLKYSPTADGKSPAQRLQAGGVNFNQCDETGVVSRSATTDAKAFSMLDKSKLTNAAFKRVGIGHDSQYLPGG